MRKVDQVVSAVLLAMCATSTFAAPIYSCLGQDERKVFQATPCSNNRMDSLADTHASEVYRHEVAAKEARELERRRAEAARIEQARAAAAANASHTSLGYPLPSPDEVLTEQKRQSGEREAIEYLRLCISGNKDCTIGTLAFMLQGSRMGPFEELLGEGREQKFGTERFFYYSLSIHSGRYRLQVQYDVNRTRVPEGGQVGNVIREVDF